MAPVMQTSSVYATQQLDDSIVSEKNLGGFQGYTVKNGFYDEEVPPRPELERSKTAPPQVLSSLSDEEGSDADACPAECSMPQTDETTTAHHFDFHPQHGMFEAPMSAALPANHAMMSYMQPFAGQWLPMEGQQFTGYAPFVVPQNQSSFPFAGGLNQPALHGDQTFSMPPEFMSQAQALSHQDIGPMEPTAPFDQAWEVIEEASQPFQPQSLRVCRNRRTGSTQIAWTVDAKKLRSNDRLTVSPLFKVDDGHADGLPFKMMISPKAVVGSDGKGSGSFGKAKGRAIVQLKCEAPRDEPDSKPITFCLSADSGRTGSLRQHDVRGPVTHNFAKSGVCGLPKDNDIWDFLDVVDDHSKTFVVRLEVLPCV